jgi:hypothetical protein
MRQIRISGSRLQAGASSFTAAKVLPASDEPPFGVPLSDSAIAVLRVRKWQLSVAVETWP